MSIYREYDIRGIYEEELDKKSVTAIGYVLSRYIKGNYVAVGYDARSHSTILFDYLVYGLNAGGKKVLDMGLIPTPVSYFANFQTFSNMTPNATVMITGSHNPSEYNGFKITIDKLPFFGNQIQELALHVKDTTIVSGIKRDVLKIDALALYKKYMIQQFWHLRGMKQKIVYDCGNGVAGVAIKDIFDGLSLNARGIYVEPDGAFPNHHPDPSVSENLKDIKALLEKEADIAFAYDGDADRIAVLTHKHNIKGDMLALLYAMRIKNPTIIGEVKCSQVMYDELKRRGINVVMYKTGHSNLKIKMKELDADLACEVSGHIFFKHRYFGYDDAIYATLRFLELVYDGIDIDTELDKLPQTFSTDEIKIDTTEEKKFKIIDIINQMLENPPKDFPAIKDVIKIDGVRIVFENGWGLVRASNTTPVLVTRFEAKTKQDMQIYKEKVNLLIQKATKLI